MKLSRYNRYAMKSTIFGCAAAALICSTAAHADIVEAQFDSVTPSQAVSYSLNGGASYSNTTGGMFNWTRLGGDYAGMGAQGNFITFCIELSQHISYGGQYTYDVIDLDEAPRPGVGMGTENADLLSELFGRHYDAGFNNTDAAAFQVAVWEIVTDGDLSLADGDFRVQDTGSFVDQAQTWLTSLDGTGPQMDLKAMSNPNAQDQVFVVPAPGALVLMAGGLGLMGIGARARRKNA